MAPRKLQPWSRPAWRLARRQHGAVSREQLLALGLSVDAIRHRLESGRLHELHRGVYAVGRPEVNPLGQLTAAVLACGPSAQLSHRTGAALWGIRPQRGGLIDVSVPAHVVRNRPGIRLHRRAESGDGGAVRTRFVSGIPVGDPVSILIDLAATLPTEDLEDAVNEADRLGLVSTHRLRMALDTQPRRPGLGHLRRMLDSQTFSRAQTKLERRFLPIARAAGLPEPRTQHRLNSFRVDFHWPELALVVETDGLTYHRTASQQAVDIRRDQAHVRTGLRTLRFTHRQVFFQPDYVREVLEDTVRHLA
jgi:very-short-patch-repair endonuclease